MSHGSGMRFAPESPFSKDAVRFGLAAASLWGSSERRDHFALMAPEHVMRGPDDCVGCKIGQLAPCGDRLDDVRRKEGEIDESGDRALRDAAACRNFLH